MCQCVFVAAIFFGGELARAFIELRGHLDRFVGSAADRDQNVCEFSDFHKLNNE